MHLCPDGMSHKGPLISDVAVDVRNFGCHLTLVFTQGSPKYHVVKFHLITKLKPRFIPKTLKKSMKQFKLDFFLNIRNTYIYSLLRHKSW